MGQAGTAFRSSVTVGTGHITHDGNPRHGDIGLDVLESQLRAGILAVNLSLVVRHVSKRAHALMKEGSGLHIRSDQLLVDRASVGRRLQEAVYTLVTAQDPAEIPPVVIGVPNNDGRIHYAIKVLTTLHSLDGESLALLIVVDLLQQDSVSRGAVASLFGFSDREAELADFFSQGMRVDEIAEAMGIAVNTARVHLRSVFNKTGCGSQIELARLFALVP